LQDVTADLLKAGEEAVHRAEQQKNDKLEQAAKSLADVVKDRAASADPILKTDAQEFLCDEQHLSRQAARTLINEQENILWCIRSLPAGRGKGTPKALFPIQDTASKNSRRQSKDHSGNPYGSEASEAPYSANGMNSTGQEKGYSEPLKNGHSEKEFTSPVEKLGAAEKTTQKAVSNGAYRDSFYSAAEDSETEAVEDAEVV
jgi:hypothetical protein